MDISQAKRFTTPTGQAVYLRPVLLRRFKTGSSILAGLSTVTIAVFPFFLSSGLTTGWAITIIGVAAVGILAIIAQGVIQSREDKIRDAKDADRDRLLRRMHDQMFHAGTTLASTPAAPETSKEVLETDPRIYIEILDERKSFHSKTVFVLRNRGKAVAHRVQIHPLKLNCGQASFQSVETIASDEEKHVVPEIENITPVFRHDITKIMVKEWDNAGDLSVFEFSRPMSITYEDYSSKRKFDTTFDLVYLVVQDILQRDWPQSEEPPVLQVRKVVFRTLPR